MDRFSLSANVIGFGLAAALGILAQLLIGRHFGAITLGLFNQSLALYLLLSQVAVIGLHIYAQRRSAIIYGLREPSAAYGSNQGDCSAAALGLASISATLVVILTFFAADIIGYLFKSEQLPLFILYILPAIWFMAINKVLLGIAIGHHRFRIYALGQAGRPIMFCANILLVIYFDLSHEFICLALSAAEICIFLIVVFLLRRDFGFSSWRFNTTPFLEAFHFGIRAMPATFAAVANSRVDVLILGFYASDYIIGIYSMAIVFIDAMIQIPVVMRTFINPSLAINLNNREYAKVRYQTRKMGNLARISVVLVVLTIAAAFPWLASYVLHQEVFVDARLPFIIIGAGLIVGSRWLPADQLLAQAGFPAKHSYQKFIMLLITIVLVSVLVPFFGTTGAALGYGASFAVYGIVLKLLVSNFLGFKL